MITDEIRDCNSHQNQQDSHEGIEYKPVIEVKTEPSEPSEADAQTEAEDLKPNVQEPEDFKPVVQEAEELKPVVQEAEEFKPVVQEAEDFKPLVQDQTTHDIKTEEYIDQSSSVS